MKIFVNHQQQELASPMHLDAVLDLLQPKNPFAISINCQFVAKVHYESTILKENDHIEIISPVTGG
ncbi:MAG: sulfur carrier protein ThiS [Betaproteobacteria bacterium]